MIHLGTLLTGLIQGLRRVVAAAAPAVAVPARPVYANFNDGWVMPPHAHLPILPGPVWSLLWLRLHRLSNRLARLYELWQSGTLPTPRPKSATRRPGAAHQDPARPRALPARIPHLPCPGAPLADAPARLPRAHGWIIRRIPAAGPSAGWLNALLQHDHTRAFVAAAPQAARLLRPLCRALAVDLPAWLQPPPRPPRKPRAPRPRPARPRRDRPLPLTHPDLRLQPYVIRAVRASIKKYGRDG